MEMRNEMKLGCWQQSWRSINLCWKEEYINGSCRFLL